MGNVKAEAGGQARIFCFGIGIDVNTHLLDRITEETRAVSQYVLPEEDLEVKVSNFFSKIKEPVLANPTLRITGDVRLTKLYPSSLPDLFKGEQLVLVGRYSGKGDAVVVVEGAVNGTARKFTYETALPGGGNLPAPCDALCTLACHVLEHWRLPFRISSADRPVTRRPPPLYESEAGRN